ncbi:MAG: nucleotidyl transferase AbiEii/AbiGii toxin family protein [Candidatus Micrarchaeota archaeon]
MAIPTPNTGQPSELKDFLKHPPEAFSKEELSKRAKKYGFTQPQFLELLAWDYELAEQLQAANDELILKGGAAVQLYLPQDAQRCSTDADFLAPGMDAGKIERIMGQVRSQISMLSGFKDEVHRPEKPDLRIPMLTHKVTLPSAFGQMGRTPCQIKVEFLFTDFAPPTTDLPAVETIALQVNNVKALSLGSLIGDKLCTLAVGTIGIRRASAMHKHVYDLEMLAFGTDKLNPEAISDAHYALNSISIFESKIRGKKHSVQEVLESVQNAMEDYSRIDLGTFADEMREARESLDIFQQQHIPVSQKKSFYAWSAKAQKIRFLAGIFKQIEEGTPQREAWEKLESAKKEEKRLASLSGIELKQAKEELLGRMKTASYGQKGIKELNEKPVGRIYWNAVP